MMLKRCPFCGAKAESDGYLPYDGYQREGMVYYVRCTGCRAEIMGLSRNAVIKEWNKRVNE